MSPPHSSRRYEQNHGVPGVVYVLVNDGLREGFVKIGCSRRSGAIRAKELNDDANTGTPGMFRCVFECATSDCGRAEQEVFRILAAKRRGKWGQEFFEVSLAHAQAVVANVCRTPTSKKKAMTELPRGSSSRTTSRAIQRLGAAVFGVSMMVILGVLWGSHPAHTTALSENSPHTALPPPAAFRKPWIAIVNHRYQNVLVRVAPQGGKDAANPYCTLPRGAIVTVNSEEVLDKVHHVPFVRIAVVCRGAGDTHTKARVLDAWVSANGLDAYPGPARDASTPQPCTFIAPAL